MSLLSYGSTAVLTKQSLNSNGEHHINISSLSDRGQAEYYRSLYQPLQCGSPLPPAAAQYYCVARRAGLATVIRTAASSFLQNC